MNNDKLVFRTREAIRKAFLELLDERVLQKIDVVEIAARAKVSRSTFYHYYDDIYSLLGDCVENYLSMAERIVPESCAPNLIDRLHQNVVLGARLAKKHRRLYLTCLSCSSLSTMPQFYSALMNKELIYQQQAIAKLGVVEENCLIPIRSLALVGSTAVSSIFEDWLRLGCRESEEEIARIASVVWFRIINSFRESCPVG